MSGVTRTAFSVSRDLELASQDGLTKRMGIIREGWLRATVKELIDNGLDACEEAGTDPEIKVTVADSVLTVADNGPGMAPDMVERLCTLTERTSAREAYAAPDRGAQGNALQTIMMLGFGFGRETSGLTIESRGVNHQLTLRVNRLAGTIELQRVATEAPAGAGTSVSIAWPEPISDHVWHLAYEHAWLNPHAGFSLVIDGEDAWSAEPTTPARKWTPGLPIPAHWYTPERFAHRILLEIARFTVLFMPANVARNWATVISGSRPDTIGPHNRYGGLVIVEKNGVADLLIMAGVGERFDVAIVGNEGQSVEAELRLADALGLPVFVLHDFDRTGMTICENLREGTWRYRYQNEIEVIEIGLRLDQVRDLESEPITDTNRKSVGDDRLRECDATAEEIEFLRTRRVELNALITADLVKMVETALTEHGVQKIVPDTNDLAAAWRSAKAHAEIAEAVEKANEHAQRWQDEPAPDDLTEQVRALLEKDPTLPWDAALLRIARKGTP